MSVLSGFSKIKKYKKTTDGYQLQSEWTSSETVEFADGKTAEEKLGSIIFTYKADENKYYAQYGDDETTKKALGEIEKDLLLASLENGGFSLTENSTAEEIYAELETAISEDKCSAKMYEACRYAGAEVTEDMTFEEMCDALMTKYPEYRVLVEDGIVTDLGHQYLKDYDLCASTGSEKDETYTDIAYINCMDGVTLHEAIITFTVARDGVGDKNTKINGVEYSEGEHAITLWDINQIILYTEATGGSSYDPYNASCSITVNKIAARIL